MRRTLDAISKEQKQQAALGALVVRYAAAGFESREAGTVATQIVCAVSGRGDPRSTRCAFGSASSCNVMTPIARRGNVWV